MLAIVVYTGKDSKIIMNQGHYSYKYSSIEKKLNRIFSIQILQVILIAAIFTICGSAFVKEHTNSPQYSISPANASKVVGFSFLSFFLMLMRLIPLDLIINTEVGKIIVSRFMESDAEMIKLDHETGDLISARV